jgi:hypothetical protein
MIKLMLLFFIVVLSAIIGSMFVEPFVDIVAANYSLSKEQEDDFRKRQEIQKFVPSFVSQDVYKSIVDKEVRNMQLLNDLFYLLDIIITHNVNEKNIMSNLHILVGAKFLIDYEIYLDNVNPEKFKLEFEKRYANKPGASVAWDSVRQASVMYKANKAHYDKIIFSGVPQEMPFPTLKPPDVIIPVSANTVVTPTKNTNVIGTSLTRGELEVKPPSVIRNDDINTSLLHLYKKAIEALINNKETFYKIYKKRKTDAEFLNVPSFAPVILYVKFLEENKENTNINPTIVKEGMNKLFPNFTTDERYFVHDMHIQTFLVLASNLYVYSASETNMSLGQFAS